MLWMQNYLHYCSVRLGVIFIAIWTFLESLILSLILFIKGAAAIEPFLKLLRNTDGPQVVKHLIRWIDKDSSNFLLILQLCFFLRILTCILATYGAYKLKKLYLIAYILTNTILIFIDLAAHITFMMCLKRTLNLGALIAVTMLGILLILCFAYNLAAAVALYQIIELINSQYYQKLYGKSSPLSSPQATVKLISVRPHIPEAKRFQPKRHPATNMEFKQYAWRPTQYSKQHFSNFPSNNAQFTQFVDKNWPSSKIYAIY